MARDLSLEPIKLNALCRVTEDELQWIVQRRRKDSGRGGWQSVIYCQTKAGLLACIGYECYRDRRDRSRRLAQPETASCTPAARARLHGHGYRSRACPGSRTGCAARQDERCRVLQDVHAA